MNLLTTLTPNKGEKISVVGKYDPYCITGDKFAALDENLNPVLKEFKKDNNLENYYYGISTKLTATILINTISSLRIKNRQDLEDFIKEYHDMFMFHAKDKDKLRDFAFSAVISLLSMYSVTIVFNNKNEFKKLDERYKKKIINNKLVIEGPLEEDLYNKLKEHTYTVWNDEIKVSKVPGSGETIEEVYKNKKNIKIPRLFYSGCLLKTLKIENKTGGNVNVQSYNIFFERTSFAAVYSLNTFVKHTFIKDNKFYEYLKQDDELACKFRSELEKSNTENKDIINKYLENTISAVQIGVSGMFETSDGYIVLTNRAKGEYDADEFYPSVNGNAEIDDPNVDLYEDSVSEDCPTVRLDGSRIDFLGEINREAYAELKVDLSQSGWDCLGISICGTADNNIDYLNLKQDNKQKDKQNNKIERRMQLNVIFKQSLGVDKTLADVRELREKAVEKYETKSIEGIRFNVYDNWWFRTWRLIVFLGKAISEIKGIVSSAISLVLFLVLLFNKGDIGGTTEIVSRILSGIVFAISIGNVGVSVYKTWKNNRWTKSYFVVKGQKTNNKINKILEKKFPPLVYGIADGKKTIIKTKFHPVTYISLKLMLEDKNDYIKED